jgi:aspartokinase
MSRPWVVLKYGGTSVANVKNWGAIVKRVKELLPTNRVWLVVSALSGVSAAGGGRPQGR